MISIVTSVPAIVDWRGGTIIALTGTFPTGTDLYAYLGSAGDFTDESCYMGVAGSGYVGRSLDGTTLSIVTPRLNAIGSMTLSVYSATETDSDSIEVIEGCFSDVLFEMRTRWPDFYDVGPRSMEQEPDQ